MPNTQEERLMGEVFEFFGFHGWKLGMTPSPSTYVFEFVKMKLAEQKADMVKRLEESKAKNVKDVSNLRPPFSPQFILDLQKELAVLVGNSFDEAIAEIKK